MAPIPYVSYSPEGMAARWLRWAASVTSMRSPVSDTTGKWAGFNQPDDVWFLAGSFGATVERRCSIPAGRPLFLPAVNKWYVQAYGPPPGVDRAFGKVVVDGKDLLAEEVSTPIPFEVAGAWANSVNQTSRPVPMTVWGLWKYLEPLPTGAHTLRIVGGDGYGFRLAVTYHVTVVGPAGRESEAV